MWPIQIFFYRAAFFVGWLLSPFTFWNDAFINIPLAYVCAGVCAHFIKADFLILVLAFYWLSNFLGIAIMYVSGKKVIGEGRDMLKEMISLLATVVLYSLLLIAMDKIGISKYICSILVKQ